MGKKFSKVFVVRPRWVKRIETFLVVSRLHTGGRQRKSNEFGKFPVGSGPFPVQATVLWREGDGSAVSALQQPGRKMHALICSHLVVHKLADLRQQVAVRQVQPVEVPHQVPGKQVLDPGGRPFMHELVEGEGGA